MNNPKCQLAKICKSKGYLTWNSIRDYAYQFEKYDNLTFRDIDEVLLAVTGDKN